MRVLAQWRPQPRKPRVHCESSWLGIGLKPWGRHILEFFCWTLIVLVALSAATRLYALTRQRTAEPINWLPAVAGLFVVAIPIIAICAATIVTLRSEAVRQAFSG